MASLPLYHVPDEDYHDTLNLHRCKSMCDDHHLRPYELHTRHTDEFVTHLRMVAELTHFPPGLIPLIAAYLPCFVQPPPPIVDDEKHEFRIELPDPDRMASDLHFCHTPAEFQPTEWRDYLGFWTATSRGVKIPPAGKRFEASNVRIRMDRISYCMHASLLGAYPTLVATRFCELRHS